MNIHVKAGKLRTVLLQPVNGGLFHWPCKFINTQFPYSASFLRSIHTTNANSCSALSY